MHTPRKIPRKTLLLFGLSAVSAVLIVAFYVMSVGAVPTAAPPQPMSVKEAIAKVSVADAGGVIVPTAASSTGATIASEYPDYPPGATVKLIGAGWASNEVVTILVNDDAFNSWTYNGTATADDVGSFTLAVKLPNWFVATYSVIATGPTSGQATSSFTDANPSANLDQCANGKTPSPSTDGCNGTTGTDWVNGNVNEAKSVYYEGDSIAYRMLFDNLSLTSPHTIIIKWDTTKGGLHAIDYLTTFNRTVLDANPCLGVSGCSPLIFDTEPILPDPQVTGAGVTPVAGDFTLYGGTITGVSAYSYPDGAGFAGDKSAQIAITFTASRANPVLAWGGHIATRADWGLLNSAVTISGSPYHTALVDLDGSGGSQDRSLSASAVIFPGSITIIKDATPNGLTSFPFTASPSPLASFNLVDDGTSANTKVFSNITDFTTYGVAETVPAGWTLTGIVCSVTSPNGGSQTVTSPSVSINLAEGENVTCTYSDQRQAAHLIVIKHVVNDNGGTNVASEFTMTINGVTADGGNSFPGAESPGTDKALSTVGSYNVTESVRPATALRSRATALARSPLVRPRPARSRTTTLRRSCTCARSSSTTTAGPQPIRISR